MISRKNGILVSRSLVMPCHEGQSLLLADRRQRTAYVFMAIHAETLNFIHNLDSVILSRLLVVPQAEPENLLADGGEEVVFVFMSTLGVEVFVGCMVCHVACLSRRYMDGISGAPGHEKLLVAWLLAKIQGILYPSCQLPLLSKYDVECQLDVRYKESLSSEGV